MNATDDMNPSGTVAIPGQPSWPGVLKRLAIWGLFLAALYVARDFFFTGFMTFLFSYMTLAVVGRGMQRLSPNRERPGLRRLLTVAVFVLVPLALLGGGFLVGPRLIEQGQRLAGWLAHVSPETEATRLLENPIGSYEFQSQYGKPGDPRYQKGLEEFRATGVQHVQAYNDFPHLEAWVEGGFKKQFDEAESGRIRARLLREGTSSQEFTQWFLKEKVPELQEQARKQVPDKGRPSAPLPPLVREAASAQPEQLLAQARHEPAVLEGLRPEWVRDTLEHDLATAKRSPAYHEQLRAYYEKQREQSPSSSPYTYEQYLELQQVRPQGARAFGEAVEKMLPTPEGEGDARLRANFEAAKKHELFQQWWGTSAVAKFLRQHLETGVSDDGGRVERIVTSLLNVPLDLSTALLLSLFICIDFPNLKRGFARLRQTWLRDVYDEMAPAFTQLGQLIGRALHAQGLIALCNATMMFLALMLLGVEHQVLLSVAVFILCLVPTLGMMLAWVLIVAMALVQPGGGMILALKATAAVLVVILLETFVFSPRILGKMMELHPVLIITVLPLAQYFFGVWGLILATPVAVYVLYVLILQQELPGMRQPREDGSPGSSAPPANGPPASDSAGKARELAAHRG
jgi:predicted PurR-regulated permease PerM